MRTLIIILLFYTTIITASREHTTIELGVMGGFPAGTGLFLKYNHNQLSFKIQGNYYALDDTQYHRELSGTVGYMLNRGDFTDFDLVLSFFRVDNFPYLASASCDGTHYSDFSAITIGARFRFNPGTHFKIYLGLEGGVMKYDSWKYAPFPVATLGASFAF